MELHMPHHTKIVPAASGLDRLHPAVPAAENPAAKLEDRATSHRDRSTHRTCHILFEDMLN